MTTTLLSIAWHLISASSALFAASVALGVALGKLEIRRTRAEQPRGIEVTATWVSREDFAKLSRPPDRPSIPRFATIGECLMAGYHLDFLPGDRIGCAHCDWTGNSAPQFASHLLTCGDTTDEGNHP